MNWKLRWKKFVRKYSKIVKSITSNFLLPAIQIYKLRTLSKTFKSFKHSQNSFVNLINFMKILSWKLFFFYDIDRILQFETAVSKIWIFSRIFKKQSCTEKITHKYKRSKIRKIQKKWIHEKFIDRKNNHYFDAFAVENHDGFFHHKLIIMIATWKCLKNDSVFLSNENHDKSVKHFVEFYFKLLTWW